MDPNSDGLDPTVAVALQALEARLALKTPFRMCSRPVQLTFGAANAQTEVLHGLGEVPDGFFTLDAGALLKRDPGTQWTKTLAYLRSDTANVIAILYFYVLREAPLNVTP